MAKGHLASTYLTTTSGTAVYTITAGKVGIINVHVLNSNASAVTADIGIEVGGSSGTLSNGEHLIKTKTLASGEYIQLTGLMLDATDSIVVKAGTGNALEVNVWGYEEDA